MGELEAKANLRDTIRLCEVYDYGLQYDAGIHLKSLKLKLKKAEDKNELADEMLFVTSATLKLLWDDCGKHCTDESKTRTLDNFNRYQRYVKFLSNQTQPRSNDVT